MYVLICVRLLFFINLCKGAAEIRSFQTLRNRLSLLSDCRPTKTCTNNEFDTQTHVRPCKTVAANLIGLVIHLWVCQGWRNRLTPIPLVSRIFFFTLANCYDTIRANGLGTEIINTILDFNTKFGETRSRDRLKIMLSPRTLYKTIGSPPDRHRSGERKTSDVRLTFPKYT